MRIAVGSPQTNVNMENLNLKSVWDEFVNSDACLTDALATLFPIMETKSVHIQREPVRSAVDSLQTNVNMYPLPLPLPLPKSSDPKIEFLKITFFFFIVSLD